MTCICKKNFVDDFFKRRCESIIVDKISLRRDHHWWLSYLAFLYQKDYRWLFFCTKRIPMIHFFTTSFSFYINRSLLMGFLYRKIIVDVFSIRRRRLSFMTCVCKNNFVDGVDKFLYEEITIDDSLMWLFYIKKITADDFSVPKKYRWYIFLTTSLSLMTFHMTFLCRKIIVDEFSIRYSLCCLLLYTLMISRWKFRSCCSVYIWKLDISI